MNNLKFRAFNKKTGEMIDLKSITPLALDSKLNQDGVFIPFDDNFVIMQFTGLRDKNRKDIYEGDIVTTPFGRIVVTDLFCNFVIYAYEDIDHMNNPESHYLVLGNIHQNPQLIS